MDIDAIAPGSDFDAAITRAVESCDVVIALIGRGWLQAFDPKGHRRLDDPADYVRREIEIALAKDVVVVPACVQGAEIPRAEDVPESLAPLIQRQGISLSDAGWQDDVARLIRRLETQPSPPPRGSARRRRLAVAAVVSLLAVGGGTAAVVTSAGDGGDEGVAPATAAEKPLLAVIPAATRPDCATASSDAPTATASLSCDVGSILTVTYHQFADAAAASAWYESSRVSEGVQADSGSCTAASFQGEVGYRVDGRTAGRMFCRLDPRRQPLLYAVDRRASVGLAANVWHGSGRRAVEDVLRLWECCIRT